MQTATATTPERPSPANSSPESVTSLLRQWLDVHAARALAVSDLAAAEARLAALSLSSMVMLALLTAVLLLSAWGLAVAAAVYGLLKADVPIWLALTSLAFFHMIAAWATWRRAVGLSEHVEFQQTRAQLAGSEGHTS